MPACHSGPAVPAGFRMTSRAQLMGQAARPVRGSSRAIRKKPPFPERRRHACQSSGHAAGGRIPPDAPGVSVLKRWIEQGAAWPAMSPVCVMRAFRRLEEGRFFAVCRPLAAAWDSTVDIGHDDTCIPEGTRRRRHPAGEAELRPHQGHPRLGDAGQQGTRPAACRWSKAATATQAAVTKALDFAVFTLKTIRTPAFWRPAQAPSGVSGAVGGAFGLASLAIELPLSLIIVLRSIRTSPGARANGARRRLQAGVSGSARARRHRRGARSGETGDHAIRIGLAWCRERSGKVHCRKGLVEEGAPALVRLVAQIAPRLSLQVSQKTAAQAIPLIGAAGGAAMTSFHRSLPGFGPRSLHCASTRADLRRG